MSQIFIDIGTYIVLGALSVIAIATICITIIGAIMMTKEKENE